MKLFSRNRKGRIALRWAVLVAAASFACAEGPPELDGAAQALGHLGGNRLKQGRRLFDEETFGGNGRRCVTCHSPETGTFNPEEARARLALPSDPLFVHDGTDDGVSGTSRITAHATIAVTVKLPPYVTLAGDPSATTVTLLRGVPSTVNTPALDPRLMYDGRAPTLEAQAREAIRGHAQAGVEPTALELELIAEVQRKDTRFFSSPALARFAAGGPPPRLPAGTTWSERRGRAMFNDVPFDPVTKEGICAMCHSGPMLNTSNQFNPFAPEGARFFSIGVAERNLLGNPVHTFLVDDGGPVPTEVTTPDPGAMLTEGLGEFPPFFPKSFGASFFKTPQLWGVARTAPYFHDNSAKTLAEVPLLYDAFFRATLGFGLSAQDQADMVSFLELL